MKKFISILLAAIMAFSVMIPAFAENEETCDCGNAPVVIVRGLDFGGLYFNPDDAENRTPLLSVDAMGIIGAVFQALFKGIITFNVDNAIDVVLEYVGTIFDGMKMNPDGSSYYENVGPIRYPEAAGNYEELVNGTVSEFGMVRSSIEEFGGDHTYYFTYDWRLDPFVVADEIEATVNKALEETGHDKVSLVCASLGGVMTVAYLTEYGYEKVERCLFMSSAFCGAQVASDLLSGKIGIDENNLYNYLFNLVEGNGFGEFAMNALLKIGMFRLAANLGQGFTDRYEDAAYEKVLYPIFGSMLSFWAMVQAEDYDTAIEYVFGDKKDECADFIAKTQKLQDMMAGRNELISSMIDDGVKVAIVASYDTPVIPVYENSNFNGDGILETYQMSGYATIAPYGETLGDDYVAENPAYLSPDRVVDLSTAIFPEYTYIIKGSAHVACDYGTDYSEFFVWLLSEDGDFRAGVNPDYPQFMVSGEDLSLASF